MMTDRSASSGPPVFPVAAGLVSAGQRLPIAARFSAGIASHLSGNLAGGGAVRGDRRGQPFNRDTASRGAAPPASG